jgi:hypothetical protein
MLARKRLFASAASCAAARACSHAAICCAAARPTHQANSTNRPGAAAAEQHHHHDGRAQLVVQALAGLEGGAVGGVLEHREVVEHAELPRGDRALEFGAAAREREAVALQAHQPGQGVGRVAERELQAGRDRRRELRRAGFAGQHVEAAREQRPQALFDRVGEGGGAARLEHLHDHLGQRAQTGDRRTAEHRSDRDVEPRRDVLRHPQLARDVFGAGGQHGAGRGAEAFAVEVRRSPRATILEQAVDQLGTELQRGEDATARVGVQHPLDALRRLGQLRLEVALPGVVEQRVAQHLEQVRIDLVQHGLQVCAQVALLLAAAHVRVGAAVHAVEEQQHGDRAEDGDHQRDDRDAEHQSR